MLGHLREFGHQLARRRLLVCTDEKEDPRDELLLSSKALLRGALGSREYVLELGGYSKVATNGAGLLTFAQYGTTSAYQTLPMSVSSGGVNWSSEYGALISNSGLFDEFKTSELHIRWQPENPYNRGTTTTSDPLCLIYDDENVLSAVTSASNLNIYANRGNNFLSYSPDHSFQHTFRRPAPLSEYAWSNTSPDSTTVNGMNGSVTLGYDSSVLTISTTYGTMHWTFIVHARMRI